MGAGEEARTRCGRKVYSVGAGGAADYFRAPFRPQVAMQGPIPSNTCCALVSKSRVRPRSPGDRRSDLTGWGWG